jgi:hypothetical protein
VSWDINDGHIILAGLKFPQGDVNGDTMFTISLQFIEDSGISAASFSIFSMALLSIPPHLYIRRPVVVDLLEST